MARNSSSDIITIGREAGCRKGNFLGQELESDEAMQPCVFGLVHDAHPAATDLLHDAVVRDGMANQ